MKKLKIYELLKHDRYHDVCNYNYVKHSCSVSSFRHVTSQFSLCCWK